MSGVGITYLWVNKEFPPFVRLEGKRGDYEVYTPERTCKFVSSKGSDYPPVCSACGYELGIYDCEWFEDGTYGYGGNYCPNCGARRVGE